jgi:hypothetical protein
MTVIFDRVLELTVGGGVDGDAFASGTARSFRSTYVGYGTPVATGNPAGIALGDGFLWMMHAGVRRAMTFA